MSDCLYGSACTDHDSKIVTREQNVSHVEESSVVSTSISEASFKEENTTTSPANTFQFEYVKDWHIRFTLPLDLTHIMIKLELL